jgi:hypothetical protein
MKHTPGPWIFDDGGFIRSARGTAIAQMWDKQEEDFNNCDANANLIAAAPELLAALKTLADKCRTYGGLNGGKMDLSQARATIAKAEAHQ